MHKTRENNDADDGRRQQLYVEGLYQPVGIDVIA
jgi:hypothetical protein